MWLAAAAALLLGAVPCGIVCLRAREVDGIAALSAGSTVMTLVLLVLSVGFDRPIFADLALVLAMLGFTGQLVFVRFMERFG
jgi:multisubunit Na+/H+ antiporter MnhF subunit